MNPERPWLRALADQWTAAAQTERILASPRGRAALTRERLLERTELEAVALPMAQCYAWHAEPAEALLAASRSISPETRISRTAPPDGTALWWWFSRPLAIKTVPDIHVVRAIMFIKTDAGVCFTAYVDNPEFAFPIPSASGIWPWEVRMASLEADLTRRYREAYEAGGVFDGCAHARSGDHLIGCEQTIAALMTMARLYAGGGAWLAQKLLEPVPEAIPRWRRRQIQREHGVAAPPSEVKVVILRRREARAELSDEPGDVEWSCRWLVRGHWRQQFYATTGDHRLLFVLPYVKGPADKPLRLPAATVFSVER